MSIGKSLEAARTQAGLSLDQVSEVTCIRRTLVGAIERDDFTLCGGDFYARGHIRSIAKAVGTDPSPLVAQFDADHPVEDSLRSRERTPAPRIHTSSSTRHHGRALPAVVAGILLVGTAAGGAVLLLHEEAQPATPTGSTRAAAPGGDPGAPVAPAPTSGPGRAVPADKVVLRVEATRAASWVKVSDARGDTLYRGVLAKGTSRTFTDQRRVRVEVRNGSAVDLVVNGKDLGPAGTGRKQTRADFRIDQLPRA